MMRYDCKLGETATDDTGFFVVVFFFVVLQRLQNVEKWL